MHGCKGWGRGATGVGCVSGLNAVKGADEVKKVCRPVIK